MNNKRGATCGITAQRKRQRQQYRAGQRSDIPEIQGVPPDLTPVLLQALRSAAQYFQHATDEPHGPLNDDASNQIAQASSTDSPSLLVVSSILNRIAPRGEREKQNKRRDNMILDRQSWLEVLKRKLERNTNPGNISRSVPVTSFRHLWDMEGHNRVPYRRAALWLAGTLLTKSSECRVFLLAENDGGILMSWVKNVSEANQHAWNNPDHAALHVPLWQNEALLWLKYLTDEYGEYYPKLKVATLYLQQRCPSIQQEGSSICLRAMEECMTLHDESTEGLRRTRDSAMEFGEKLIGATRKLIRRAHACLDTLVPRLSECKTGGGESWIPRVDPLELVSDEDDNDEIDWEEGDSTADCSSINHATAVEETLAAMESSGGLRGGVLDVSFSTRDDDENTALVANDRAQEVLRKTVEKLSTRHMPRLSSWTHALSNADSLRMQDQALVVMSVKESQRRTVLHERLMEAKRTTANVFSSARRLGVTVNSDNGEGIDTTTLRGPMLTGDAIR